MNSRFFKRIAAPGLLGLALLAVVLLAAIGGGSSDASANNGVRGLDRAIAAQEAHTDALLALDGVVGTAVGLGGNGSAVVFVFTESAGVTGIPGRVDGVTVVPTVTGEISALHHRDGHDKGGGGGGGEDPAPDPDPVDPTARFDRPVPIGVSTGHPAITAGTIGARVMDGDGNVYALSNNHVYADQNLAGIGDAVIQPGTYDGGSSPADDIGNLSDFVTILFDGSDNVVDAAIAATTDVLVANSTPGDGYGTPSSTTDPVGSLSFRQKVVKYGRTTGLTEGKVWAINATVIVDYGDGNVARFVRQIAIQGGDFSAGGDSGSLVVTQSGKNAIGLLFAGGGRYTFLNPIEDVLNSFGVTIDGSNN